MRVLGEGRASQIDLEARRPSEAHACQWGLADLWPDRADRLRAPARGRVCCRARRDSVGERGEEAWRGLRDKKGDEDEERGAQWQENCGAEPDVPKCQQKERDEQAYNRKGRSRQRARESKRFRPAITRCSAVRLAERSNSRLRSASRRAPAMNIAVLLARTRSPPVETAPSWSTVQPVAYP